MTSPRWVDGQNGAVARDGGSRPHPPPSLASSPSSAQTRRCSMPRPLAPTQALDWRLLLFLMLQQAQLVCVFTVLGTNPAMLDVEALGANSGSGLVPPALPHAAAGSTRLRPRLLMTSPRWVDGQNGAVARDGSSRPHPPPSLASLSSSAQTRRCSMPRPLAPTRALDWHLLLFLMLQQAQLVAAAATSCTARRRRCRAHPRTPGSPTGTPRFPTRCGTLSPPLPRVMMPFPLAHLVSSPLIYLHFVSSCCVKCQKNAIKKCQTQIFNARHF